MKILIVDDDKNITNALSEHLNKEYELSIFNDPFDALNYYEKKRDFDVIITDFYMPILYGDGLINRILAINANQQFIVISGLINTQQEELLLKHNSIIQIITKPYDLKEVEDAINRIRHV